jgi:ATPase subunit of ABC transporter with duplicated ATPase domains
MISTNGITMQFGAKPLFENVSVKFRRRQPLRPDWRQRLGQVDFYENPGWRFGASGGEVAIENGVRLGKLRQDQFAYEDMRVLDVVMMGHEKCGRR